jgi:uncharacterized protein YndB with AHSA1/START domain
MTAAARSKPSDDRVLNMTRVFDAPRSLVFQTWTRKEHIDRWLAPRGFTIPFSEGDLRPGGRWRCCMVSSQGIEHWVSGTYREIIENELLVFTHAWEEDRKRGHETLVTVRFADQGAKTRITLEQATFASVESRDGHAGGWGECLERLTEHLVTLRVQSAS